VRWWEDLDEGVRMRDIGMYREAKGERKRADGDWGRIKTQLQI